jgi:hypothetical protein
LRDTQTAMRFLLILPGVAHQGAAVARTTLARIGTLNQDDTDADTDVLMMDGPGLLLLARCDGDGARGGGKRPPDSEAGGRVKGVGGIPAAIGRAERPWAVNKGTAAED